jgi:acetyltransferase
VYGIPMQRSVLAANLEEAVACAMAIGFPVALKIVSPQIVHKSGVGGVALGLASAADVRLGAQAMLERVARLRPQAQVAGFIVQAMVDRPRAHELIVGTTTDPVFGPVLLFGQGGTAVELSQNHAVALPPLNAALARDLVQRSGLATLLAGYRERPAVPEAVLLETLRQVAQMACDLPQLAELDINPLLVDAQGVLALDVRIRLHGPGRSQPVEPAIRPYPQELEQTITAAGSQLLLRPIQPEDGARLQAFYAQASAADMRLRFFLTRREVPHSELARYSQIDYDREMTFIALAPGEAAGQSMAGEIRVVCDPDNQVAEFSLQVASNWQCKGLGSQLMYKMLGYLRQRGTREVQGQCLRHNQGMAALARKAGFDVQPGPSADTLAMHQLLALA